MDPNKNKPVIWQPIQNLPSNNNTNQPFYQGPPQPQHSPQDYQQNQPQIQQNPSPPIQNPPPPYSNRPPPPPPSNTSHNNPPPNQYPQFSEQHEPFMQNQDGQANQQQPQNGWGKQDAKPKKKSVIDRVQEIAGENFNKLTKNQVAQEIGKKIDNVKVGIITEFDHLDKKARDMFHQQKENLNVWVRLKIEQVILKILQQLRPNLQECLKDPYMCECVQNLVDDIFDEVWPQIEDEILFQLRLKLSEPYSEKINVKPKLCCIEYPWFWLKSWYLYSVDPFDRSIWYQMRTFSWWFFFLLKLIPFYGIQSFLYLFAFLCIDKRDEFQLVNYILVFKRMQFVTIGGIGTVIGYFTFYSCSTVTQLDDSEKYRSCKEDGPAIFLNVWFDIVGYLLQIILVWIAFCLLPFSKPKGQPKFRYHKEQPAKQNKKSCCCCEHYADRGGRLRGFMIFDLISFVLCLCLFFALSITDGEKAIWQYKATMYLTKTVYGLLSLPFIVFVIPFMTLLLTKSRDTGYDKYGNCLPQISDLKQYNKDLQKQKKEQYDRKYTQAPERKITLIEEEPLLEEII